MKPTIIFDLDYTIYNPGENTLHPEAHLVLKRAKKDFGRTMLWTFGGTSRMISSLLLELGIAHYFDGVIASDHNLTEISRIRNDRWGCKDLRLFAPGERPVMIENDDFAVPKHRRILVPDFDGKEHDLRTPYQLAYLAMYHEEEFRGMTPEQRLAAAEELERGYVLFRDKDL
ncbi:hypothetical protein KY326_01885 [Candidatus Woesearchaeota archaeon]|nr:hypothetical protein [Candidatus Woesearchaeota archaeon]